MEFTIIDGKGYWRAVGADTWTPFIKKFQIGDLTASIMSASYTGSTTTVPIFFPDKGYCNLHIDTISLSHLGHKDGCGNSDGTCTITAEYENGASQQLYYKYGGSYANVDIDISDAVKVTLSVSAYCHNNSQSSSLSGIVFS